ncbi:MAG: hypothetical protein WA802_05180 [Terracidiphilus sp.]
MNFEHINPAMIVGAVAVVLLVLSLVVVIVERKRNEKTRNLRLRFGPEYDLLLRQSDSRKNAEDRLLAREKRIELLKIRDLKSMERTQFLAAWELVQSRFVDHPRGAVIEADELINAILRTRGFPSERFEQRAADLSVDHADLVESYRAANEITTRAARNLATTEELRLAMLNYHALFDDLLQVETRFEQSAVA